MAQLSSDELLKYAHSPAHYAVVRRDHAGLRRLISRLPKLAEAGEIKTEAESIREEQRADEIATVLDRRDVPRRETPLHLAVRISDATAAEILMEAGANWSLQNDQGWSALQEAICFRRDDIAKVIIKHYQPMAWAKWCRRLPRLISCMRRMRDFYMEIAFHFESSVIPFVGRIAPSDTYRIWKRDANLRADTTLAGFDGFKIQRSEQSFLFLGEGSDDGRVPAGSLLMLSHKDKEIMNAFEDAGHRPTDSEVAQEAAAMAQTNVYRPGIDVTRAELLPQFNWRRQEKVEMVGTWKSRVYDMHHVMLSFKSRKVPCSVHEESDMDLELLTEDERRQVDNALRINDELDLDLDADVEDGFLVAERPADMRPHRHSSYDRGDFYLEKKERFTFSSSSSKNANFELQFSKEEKEWVLGRRSFDRSGCPVPNKNAARPSKNSMSDLLGSRHFSKKSELQQGRRSMDVKRSDFMGAEDGRKWVGKEQSGRRRGSESNNGSSGGGQENVYKKGLRPVLWLTPHFPLKTEELLPLLDILADKVKAVRRLRELLTTKLPTGTFPIKVAIPVVPTIRVVITFSKFEELPPSEEFCTPPSSPAHLQDLIANESQTSQESSNSWFQWIKGPSNKSIPVSASPEDQQKEVQDPFAIPADYTWTTLDAKKRQMKEKKSKAKKGKKSHSVDVSDNVVER